MSSEGDKEGSGRYEDKFGNSPLDALPVQHSFLSLLLRDVKRFIPWIGQGYLDILDTFAPVRWLVMFGVVVCALHTAGLSIMHMWRHENQKDIVEFLTLQVAQVVCAGIGWQLWNWHTLSYNTKRFSTLLSSSAYMIALILNLVLNASKGRTSGQALLDAAYFCCGSILTFRSSIWWGWVANISPCFSWHFSKRTFTWLAQERGMNLSHISIACCMYSLTCYIGTKLHPHISSAIEFRKEQIRRKTKLQRDHAEATVLHKNRGAGGGVTGGEAVFLRSSPSSSLAVLVSSPSLSQCGPVSGSRASSVGDSGQSLSSNSTSRESPTTSVAE